MAEVKKLIVRFPQDVCRNVEENNFEIYSQKNRFTKMAMRYYIIKKKDMKKKLRIKSCYRNMVSINLSICEIGIYADYEQMVYYEEWLREMEI